MHEALPWFVAVVTVLTGPSRVLRVPADGHGDWFEQGIAAKLGFGASRVGIALFFSNHWLKTLVGDRSFFARPLLPATIILSDMGKRDDAGGLSARSTRLGLDDYAGCLEQR